MRKFIKVLLLGSLTFSAPVFSLEYEGVTLPDTVALPGTDVQLRLNGAGMRTKFIVDVYIGALYTEKAAVSRDDVLAQKGPNRVLMHFVYDEVGAEKLVNGWNQGFEDNLSDAQLDVLNERIKTFNAMFTTVYEGDVVLLDYVPGRGTVVTVRGEEKGVIKGEDFNRALLDIWLGEEPADGGLKDAMLNRD